MIESEQKRGMLLTIQPWQKRTERDVFASYRRISRKTFVLPNGAEAEFEIKQEPRCVCVLALTTRQTVLLVHQFRPGPEAILLELPGGGVSPGEDPASAAARELLEETGYGGEMELAGSSWHCGYSTRRTYHFVARSCVKIQEPRPDELEFLEVVEMPLADFQQHVRSGNLTDGAGAYMGLEKLNLL
jgi:ADP-ribose pyrophosphatase